MRGTRVGVHRPSRPACVSVGCSALLGQTFMHSPQRMQRERKSDSSSAPGGRSSRSWRSLPSVGIRPHEGNNARAGGQPGDRPAPAQVGRSHFLLLAKETEFEAVVAGSSPRNSCTSGTRTCAMARPRWDRRHPGSGAGNGCSDCSLPRPCAGPGSTSGRRRPAAHPADKSSGTRSRVTRTLAARMAMKRIPRNKPWVKCGWRNSSTTAPRIAWMTSPVDRTPRGGWFQEG